MAGLHRGKIVIPTVSVPPGPNGHVYQIWFKRRPGGTAVPLPGLYSGFTPAGRVVTYRHRLVSGAHYIVPVGDNPNIRNAHNPRMLGWFIIFG